MQLRVIDGNWLDLVPAILRNALTGQSHARPCSNCLTWTHVLSCFRQRPLRKVGTTLSRAGSLSLTENEFLIFARLLFLFFAFHRTPRVADCPGDRMYRYGLAMHFASAVTPISDHLVLAPALLCDALTVQFQAGPHITCLLSTFHESLDCKEQDEPKQEVCLDEGSVPLLSSRVLLLVSALYQQRHSFPALSPATYCSVLLGIYTEAAITTAH